MCQGGQEWPQEGDRWQVVLLLVVWVHRWAERQEPATRTSC